MGRGILRGAGGDENLKSNFIWPYIIIQLTKILWRINTLVTNSTFVKRTSIKSVLMYIFGIVHILIEPNTFNDKYVYVIKFAVSLCTQTYTTIYCTANSN